MSRSEPNKADLLQELLADPNFSFSLASEVQFQLERLLSSQPPDRLPCADTLVEIVLRSIEGACRDISGVRAAFVSPAISIGMPTRFTVLRLPQ
ncbi:hypothetical protein HU675_0037350 [Bradyrhizobium septentrionale]|uniref:hypothetical protein n=1 Tax=Bradyrhizobium septentrionale TaxID=1404411 RepID=UPI0015967D5C|nr:hypothetical protein [Bradyrhizobium septentrionale]UGY23565.1 hypothetical protein HU675_0037350 [Bradyrhizobium septentrionale]